MKKNLVLLFLYRQQLKRVIHSEPGASSDTINPRPMSPIIFIQNIQMLQCILIR